MKNVSKKVLIIIFGIIFLIALAVITAIYLINNNVIYNASVKADNIEIISKVSGQIIHLNFDKNSQVKKGEILLQIESDKYQKELDEANENLKKAQEELKISKKEIERINSLIAQSKNDIKDAKLKLENANNDYVIYKNSYKDGTVTKKDLEKAEKNLDTARNLYNNAQENLRIISEELGSKVSKKATYDEKIKELLAKVEKAELNLSYTTIISTIDGTITDKKVNLSDNIKENDVLASIASKNVYIIANLNEKQIKNIKKNQEVLIKIKGIKEQKGTVEEINNNTIKINFTDDISKFNISPDKKAKIKL